MTIVNGKIVVKDGILLTMNTEDVRVNANKIANDIVKYEREHR